MKKHLIALSLSLFFTLFLIAQEQDLSLLHVPDSLKTNADAIVRYERTAIEMTSYSKMNIHVQKAVSVLNSQGDDNGSIDLHYDDYSKIKSVTVKIFDVDGKEIKKIKKNDFSDESAVDGSTLFGDARILSYEYNSASYPYTLAYDLEIQSGHTAFIPGWFPIRDYRTGVQESVYTFQYPTELTIRSKKFNTEGLKFESVIKEGYISYKAVNLKPVESEPKSPGFYDFMPHIKFASNKFSLAGEDGEADDIVQLGKWMNDRLLIDRDDLNETTRKEIKALVKDEPDDIGRARLVYDYMQEKTRYISIQIGIGGWKPMKASEVDRLKYGDCKALTNYTHSLLKEAGVISYYTVIYAKQRRDYNHDLAAIEGNHVILMVPAAKDTVWLECTNQKIPFGHLGSFTDDRDALAITPQGGKIVHTKTYPAETNKQQISGALQIDNNGKILADIMIESSGIQYDNHYRISYLDEDEKDRYYKSFFDEINNLKIDKIEVENNEKEVKFIEKIQFSADNFAVNSGDKMLVRLNVVNTSSQIPKRIRNRKLPLEIRYGYVDKDDVIINLPENYEIEAMGAPERIDTKFGTYSISIEKISDRQLKYIRTLSLHQGLYTVADYNTYRKFRKKINNLDNLKIVLNKI